MTSAFIPKRPHKKSRAGCRKCKEKKIKCDEVRPRCGFCALRNLKCQFTTPSPKSASSPSSTASDIASADTMQIISKAALPSPSMTLIPGCGSFRPEDMLLMHHYSTFATDDFVAGEGPAYVMRYVFPPMALQTDFLLNAMLGVAAAHRRTICPENAEYQKQLVRYRAKALEGYQALLPSIDNLSQTEYEAMVMMCVILVPLFGQDLGNKENLTIIRWLQLYNGLQLLLDSGPGWSSLMASGVMPLFVRDVNELRVPPAVPTILLDMLSSITPEDPDAANLETYCQTLDQMGILYASLRQDGLDDPLGMRVISWLSRPSREFTALATRKEPRAMVILAYYLCFIRLAKTWWFAGLAEQEVPIICGMLGPQWMPYLEVPLRIANCTGQEEIIGLLLG